MGVLEQVTKDVTAVLNQTWDVRNGILVPETAKVKLTGGAVRLYGTFLYADLANSTELALGQDARVAAKVCRAFMAVTTRLIRERGGDIRSFDGDRVMAIFLGADAEVQAVYCAMEINHVMAEVLRPRFEKKYPRLVQHGIHHGVGIDASQVLAVRGGIRRYSDLVWIGRAPNVAAKLSSVREGEYTTFITDAVYKALDEDTRFFVGTSKRQPMWQERNWKNGPLETYYRSAWQIAP
jgi:adenylate cyclase